MKLKRKLIIAIAILSAVSINLTGCGNAGQFTPNESVVIKPLESKVHKADDSESASQSFTPSKEILEADIYSDVLQIGDKMLTLPTKLENILLSGAGINDSNLSENFLMESYMQKEVEMIIDDTKFNVMVENRNSERCSLKDANVTLIQASGSDIIFPLGIRHGASLSDLTDNFGEATTENPKDDELIYYYTEYPLQEESTWSGITKAQYQIQIDRNTSNITSIKYISSKKALGMEMVEILDGPYNQFSVKVPLVLSVPNDVPIQGLSSYALLEIDGIEHVIHKNTGNGRIDYAYEDKEFIVESFNDKVNVKYYMDEKIVYYIILYPGFNDYHCQFKLTPYNENDNLSENAIDQFQEIVNEFINSIKELER